MDRVNQALLFFHFLGLTLGFTVSFGNMVLGPLMAKASPEERAILGRVPPALSRLGRPSMALLWITGILLVFTKWGGFGEMPGVFHAKLTVVVLLTGVTEHVRALQRRAAEGVPGAAQRIEPMGKAATTLALIAMLLAVLTFD